MKRVLNDESSLPCENNRQHLTMACQHLTGYDQPCGNPIRRFGSCRVHQQRANRITEEDTPQDRAIFNEFVREYKKIIEGTRELANSSKGEDGTKIRKSPISYCDQVSPIHSTDSDEIKDFNHVLIDSQRLITKYQHLLDQYLIKNVALQIQDSILD